MPFGRLENAQAKYGLPDGIAIAPAVFRGVGVEEKGDVHRANERDDSFKRKTVARLRRATRISSDFGSEAVGRATSASILRPLGSCRSASGQLRTCGPHL